jgi:hypothetical protein
MMEISSDWLQGREPMPAWLHMFIFEGFAWALQTTRNKMTIEKNFPKATTDVIYAVISLMQKWSILLKEEDRRRILRVKESLLGWLKAFIPSVAAITDIVEI